MVVLSAFEACKIGDIETLKRLPNVEQQSVDNNGACCLHYAARGGNLAVVEYLVKSLKFSVLARTKTGAKALHDAAARGNTAVVKWLVEDGGVDVNDQDSAGVTALHLAARYCHFLTIEWLLDEASADASVRSSAGALPLHFAVVGGDINCVKILVDESPRLINMQMNNGASPLYLASQAGHLDLVKYLLSRNAATKVNAYDAMSCLHAAAQMGHLDIVKWLVQVEKCNPNIRDFDGATPLHFAAGRGHADVVRWLLKEGGAKVTLDNLGGSPLHTAAEMGELECVQALLDCGCDVSLIDNKGLTAAELADDCGQTEAAALIRGEVTLSELGLVNSTSLQKDQAEHLHSASNFQPEAPKVTTHFSNTSTSYSRPSFSPPLPPPPSRPYSVGSTPSTTDSPISPPTPIHEDVNDSLTALGSGHGSVNQSVGEAHSNSQRPSIKRTLSRTSVDSSASNFGVFEHQDASVLHTVTAEVHKTPEFVPPTPKPASFQHVSAHSSLNSTQESILFSTSSSSFSHDETSPGLGRKSITQKTTRSTSDFNQKGVSGFHNLHSPPLAHSTLSQRKDSLQGSRSNHISETQNSSHNSNSHHSITESQDIDKEVQKFQYYYTPYRKDFNSETRSSFAKAKALFQYDRGHGHNICPDSGEVCTRSEQDYFSLNQVQPSYKMNAQRDIRPDEDRAVAPATSSDPAAAEFSPEHSHVSVNQNATRSVIMIQGKHSTITTTDGKSGGQEINGGRVSALTVTSKQAEPVSVTTKTVRPISSLQSQKDSVLQELRNKNVSQVSNSASSTAPALVNGHVQTNAGGSNHVHSSAARVFPVSFHPSAHGNELKEDERSTNPKNLSRSSSGSSTSSQPFSPVESKHNLIADIQSAVTGSSNLSLRRAKSRGEGVSMVYQSKKGASQEEVKADNLSLTGQFDPKNFLDKVEKIDSSGRVIPEWRKQILARHLAEKAQKDFEEKKLADDYEARFRNVPAWKRALIERKEAQAREEASSSKK